MLAGFCFAKGRLPREPWVMAAFGFFGVLLWVSPLLDCSHIFLILTVINLDSVIATLFSAFPVNISQSVCTVLVMLLFGKPLLDKLERIKRKYGILDSEC